MDPIIDNKMVDLESDNLEHFNSESDIDSLTGFSPKSSEMMGGQTPESEETEDLESLSELETTDKDVEKREAEKDDEYEDEDEDLREGIEEQDDAPMASTQDTTELTTLSTMEREDDFEVEDDEEIKEATSSDVESKDPSKLMDIEYTYPPPKDKNFQEKIFKKREFYYHRPQTRDELKEYPDIKAYRDKICAARFELQEHQALLSNFMNPDTPYNGLLIFHGVGTGKCTVSDQLVFINGNLIKACDIWDKYHTDIIRRDPDGGEWSEPDEELIVSSYNEKTGKIIQRPVKHLYRQPVKEKIREVILENGFSFKITQAHQLLTQSEWTNDLKKGMYVGIPQYVYNCPDKNTLKVTKELAMLLAWQIGEAHERSSYVHLSQDDTKNDCIVLDRVASYVQSVSKTYGLKMNAKILPSNKNQLNIYSADYREFLKNNGYKWGEKAAGKEIPPFIMNAPIEIIRIFLKHYFDAESHMFERDGVIQLSSASKMLIHQISYLLRIFGINSRMKRKMKMATNGKRIKRPYYELLISSYSLRIYKDEIGFNFGYKQKALEKVCERKANSNIEVIPVKKILKDLWDITHLPYRQFIYHNYIHGKTLPTVDTIKTVIQKLDYIINDRELQKRYNITPAKLRYIMITKATLEDELQKELFYIKIKDIKLEDYQGYVYDLEIEENHNYVADVIMHNTCAGISIAEKYKPMIQKYGTKIYVLVSGPFIKENWRNELLKCTGETYLKKQDATQYISQAEQQKAVKNAINVAMQYYRFMSYRSFYKKVLGEKIREQEKVKDNKVKVTYRKTEEGEFERDIAIDRIYNLNNSLIIVDEAHNLTGNAYGEALMKIIRASSNLKVILLTATPMKNLADDIIELVNFIRPANSPIERDRIFNAYKNHQMDFKEGGIEYLKQMAKGYISYLRGADPLTFAKRIEKGTIPKGLLFTKVISCQMLDFQRKTYDEIIRTAEEDTLDRRSEAVANFSFPGLTQDRKEIMGYYGNEGLNIIKNQLKTHYELLNKKIATDILGVEEGDTDFMYLTEESNTISGKILKSQYLKYFSVKFYKALKKISRLIWSKKGARTAFIYSNLVKVGIEIFQEILLQNGYLEYDENPSNYKIKPDTICYFCGHTYRDHQQMQLKATAEMKRPQDRSESSTEYELKRGEPPQHNFMPATFISVTGKTSEEAADIIPEDKKRILDNVFSHIDNKEGKYIKFVLGSRVMQEGLSLMNVAEVHILDVYFNLGKVEQVTGRAIRHCSHYKLITDENRFPTVSIYKYALTLDGKELSSEEEMYQKAELKYLLIKKVERAIKEVAIDCPLNRAANIFPEELAQYKECVPPTDMKEGEVMCPPLCDYTRCNFICDEENLNRKYYDEKSNSYRKLSKNELDYSTFTQSLARNEIETTKGKIKEMFRIKYVYTLSEIIDYVKKSYTGEKKELFDEFFIFKALDELIPITENDFNNFRDTVFDKFNRAGYLVYINKYYIFQPFDQNEDVPMFYRSTYDKPMKHELTLYNYLKNTEKLRDLSEDILEEKEREISEEIIQAYDFDSVMEYYEERNEFKYVGIIDKESTRRRTKRDEELQDVFKIRESRAKVLEKKRGTGITSLLGAVCNSRSKDYLDSVAKSVNIKLTDEMTRDETCDLLKNRLLFLEKYSHGKDKKTYMIVPANHSKYPFPLNLEDRKNNIMDKIKDKIKFKIDVKVHDHKKKIENESVITYTVEIKYEKKLEDFKGFFEGLGGKFDKNRWLIDIE